ncbi:hypothetical protein D9757_002977 [Collybiopsis confluens]|uniref:NUC153 domain-containing protein n=1 Tax=Collybiopsis confluens TaxID=2823264 RepID=A0A8H5HVK5_9AGAR|nr:hypothetical protein D9757_002977 [Collybiopsis confluens]
MSDPRFARLKSDPRFRRPKQQQSKVVVDDRFKSVFAKSKKGKNRGRVDKFGRPLSENHDQENLKRFYRIGKEAGDDIPTVPDYARGEILLESSDEAESEQEEDSDVEGFVTIGLDTTRSIPARGNQDDIDLDENNFDDLDAQAAAYSESNSEPLPVTEVDRTNRLAVVNLDWDHVRAVHLYKICSSLVSPAAPTTSSSKTPSHTTQRDTTVKGGPSSIVRGRIISVKIYPSQFGKERLAIEEREGPPPQIFKSRQMEEDAEVTEQNVIRVSDENDFDEDALRKYQLDRLRYCYAIITCDTVDAASHIYDELEGTELERSANVFDLSFVPNGMTFDEVPRDEATEDKGASYRSIEFVTDALRHSKVKLTWDDDDPSRNQLTRRKISRKELDEADFRAYLASSSSEAEPADEGQRKSISREKLRSLLLGGGNDLPEGWNDGNENGGDNSDVDMEVTFTPGLSASKDDQDETTLEKYQRKMKEKRKIKKENIKSVHDHEGIANSDDFFTTVSNDEGAHGRESSPAQMATRDNSSVAIPPNNTEPQHFSLKSVLKAEKLNGKKLKRKGSKKNKLEETEVQEDFSIDVDDERFKAIHDDHDFAIDPSNPRYTKTKAMKTLLEARSRNRVRSSNASTHSNSTPSLINLAESVKRKSSTSAILSIGKRRRLQ